MVVLQSRVREPPPTDQERFPSLANTWPGGCSAPSQGTAMDQSDRRRFDAALSKLLYSTTGTAKVSQTVLGAYWSVLRGHSWERIAAAMTRALNDSTGHVSPATLAEYCRPDADQDRERADVERATALQHRLDQADKNADLAGEKRHGPAWFTPEFRAMLDVANMEFGRRVNGRAPGGFRFPTVKARGYDGRFDYMAVVMAAPKPKGRSHDKHSKAWDYFWQLLREDFEQYQALSDTAPDAL